MEIKKSIEKINTTKAVFENTNKISKYACRQAKKNERRHKLLITEMKDLAGHRGSSL